MDADKLGKGYNPGQTQSTATSNVMSVALSEPTSQHSSHVCDALISNSYALDYAAMAREKERMKHLDVNFLKKKPIFKNYIESNANIMRSKLQKGKLQSMFDTEIREMNIVKNLQQRLQAGGNGRGS